MTPQELQHVVTDALEDIKGQGILVFDSQPMTSMFDRVVIVTGTSNRQTRAMAKNLHDKVKRAGGQVFGTEGEESGEWVLVDLGDIIVHIMQPAIRDYYRLEDIWGRHPVDWEAEREAARALREKPAPRRKATARKPISGAPAKKPAAKKPVAKPPASTPSPAKKSAAKKPAAKKPAVKKPDVKKPAAKKPAAKKPAAKKAAATRT
jgi:ribosome-associated protein